MKRTICSFPKIDSYDVIDTMKTLGVDESTIRSAKFFIDAHHEVLAERVTSIMESAKKESISHVIQYVLKEIK